VAARLAREIPGGIVLDQYANLANPEAHYYGTAAEIIEDIKSTAGISAKLAKVALTSGLAKGSTGVTSNGHSLNGLQNGHQLDGHAGRQSSGIVDLMFVGAGTGGSISGISKRLKEEWASTQVIGIDPIGSILAQPDSLNILKEGESSMYAVEGIGYDFIPQVLDRKLVDSWIKVDDKQAFEMARKLIRAEGLLIGGSSGSNMAGAIEYLTETEAGKAIAATEGKNVVVLMPDS
jgi:cystathionine beta-synthase